MNPRLRDAATQGLWPLVLGLLAASVAVAGAGDLAATALRYEREALRNGQWWRLLTAHLVHLGWAHLAMNALALVLLARLLGPAHGAARWAVLGLASALGVSCGLYLLSPTLGWYVGLSGLAHGLAAAGGAGLLRAGRRTGMWWLAALAAKLVLEQVGGPPPGLQAWIGGASIVAAHAYGAAAGLAAAWALPRPGRPPRPW